MPSRHVSRVVRARPEDVYAFARDPENLPRWAAGLSNAQVRREGDDVFAQSPMGLVRVRFVPRNEFGVLDHDVTLPDRTVVNNPLRVLTHPDGSELVFTVRQLTMTDDQFAADCEAVAADLARLAALLELPPAARP